jgi:endoglucanase
MKMPRFFIRLLCLVFVLQLTTYLAAQSQPGESLAEQRAAHLRRGINTSHWFSQLPPQEYTKEHFETFTTAKDIALIKSLGFDNVRLSINPAPMMPLHRPDEIPEEYLGYLDAAVKMILDQGLAVTIDMHPESDFKAQLATDDQFVEQFTDFWRALAQHYSSWDPNRVFFEIMNEPEFKDPYRWYGVETKLAAAIREGAPQHTIIAAGANWSDDTDLVFLRPLPVSDVIYNFHYYDPHIFTHQGATWGQYYWHWTKGLAYPSSAENVAKIAAQVPSRADRYYVIRYGQDHWDAARIEADVEQAADWAKHFHVPLICNEFGVFRAYSNPQDRAAWIHDVRTALESNGIGWAMWDYKGGFGVVNQTANGAVPDELTVQALGLKMPAASH